MAFQLENLNSGAQPSGQTIAIHGYETNDTLGTVTTDGYFDEISSRLDTGDMLLVSGDLDGTPKGAIYRIDNSSGDITLNEIAAEA